MPREPYVIYVCPRCRTQVDVEDRHRPSIGQSWACRCLLNEDLEPVRVKVEEVADA